MPEDPDLALASARPRVHVHGSLDPDSSGHPVRFLRPHQLSDTLFLVAFLVLLVSLHFLFIPHMAMATPELSSAEFSIYAEPIVSTVFISLLAWCFISEQPRLHDSIVPNRRLYCI